MPSFLILALALPLGGKMVREMEPGRNPQGDGTAVDTDGRYYVATRAGVQMFLPDGTQTGTIALPQPPISLTFGGPASDVLYIVGGASAWSIQTKVRGFRHPAGLD